MNTAAEEEIVTLGYSGANQLTSITDNDSGGTTVAAQFIYDGLGRLFQKKDGSGNVLATYYYDGTALAYETTPKGTVSYQWAGGKLLSQRPTVSGVSHTYWYMLDSLGNAKALLDGADQNRLKAVYVYDGFGNLQPSSFEDLDIENPLRYRANSGYTFLMEPQQEVEYALYNAGARTYNTDTGGWLQEDALLGIPTDPMSFNRYLYCNADPINKEDPTGLTYKTFGSTNVPPALPAMPPGAGLPSTPPGAIPAQPLTAEYTDQDCPGFLDRLNMVYDPNHNPYWRLLMIADVVSSTYVGWEIGLEAPSLNGFSGSLASNTATQILAFMRPEQASGGVLSWLYCFGQLYTRDPPPPNPTRLLKLHHVYYRP